MYSTRSSASSYASKTIWGITVKFWPKIAPLKPSATFPTHYLASSTTQRHFSALFRPKSRIYNPLTHILHQNQTKRHFSKSTFTGRQSRHGHYSEPETVPYADWPLRATIAVNLGVFLLWGVRENLLVFFFALLQVRACNLAWFYLIFRFMDPKVN